MKRILIFVSLLFINPGLRAQDAPAAIHVEVREELEVYLVARSRRCRYGGNTIGESSLEPHLASILDVYL